MSTWVRWAIGGVLAALPAISSAEETISQAIVQVLYNGSADYAFFVGAADWGAPSCPSAYYAQIPASQGGKDKMLALATAAYLAEKRVKFLGSCQMRRTSTSAISW